MRNHRGRSQARDAFGTLHIVNELVLAVRLWFGPTVITRALMFLSDYSAVPCFVLYCCLVVRVSFSMPYLRCKMGQICVKSVGQVAQIPILVVLGATQQWSLDWGLP